MKLYELYSREEAMEVINEIKQLFKSMGFTVSYDSKGHSLDRLLGRDKEITKEQMLDTFKFLILTQKKAFKPMRDKPMASMIVRDSHNKGNYVLNFKNNNAEIMTAIKKPGFQADNDRQGSIVVDLKSHPSRADVNVGEDDGNGGLTPGDVPIESPPVEVSTSEPSLDNTQNR